MKLRSLFFALAFAVSSGAAFAEETPLDTSNPPANAPTAPAQYSGPPTLKFYLSDEDYLLIQVAGLQLKQVEGFMFGGADISGAIEQFKNAGVITFKEKEDGFQMDVNIPIQQLAGKNDFSVVYASDNRLSATIDSEKLLQEKASSDRGFGWTRVYGTITEQNNCGYCGSRVYSAYASVEVYMWNGYWRYVGQATTNAYGSFSMSVQGNNASHIYVQVDSQSGKSGYAVGAGPACGVCQSAAVNASMYLY